MMLSQTTRLLVDSFLRDVTEQKFEWNCLNATKIPLQTRMPFGDVVETNQLLHQCIIWKRQKAFDEAVAGLISVLISAGKTTGAMPAGFARNLFKVLMGANEYYAAAVILYSLYDSYKAVLSIDGIVDENSRLTAYGVIADRAKFQACADGVAKSDYSCLKLTTGEYVGDPVGYRFVRQLDEIRKDFLAIKELY